MQKVVIGTVCAALFLCACDKSESGAGPEATPDAAVPSAGGSTDAATTSSAPTGTVARDASSGAARPVTDGGASGRVPEPSVVDAGGKDDAAVAAPPSTPAPTSPDASSVPAGDVAADAGVAVDAPARADWGNQPCNQESDKPGCQSESVALCICRGPDASGGNEFCCKEQWSYLCVDGVAALPECGFTSTKCCEAHPTDGCDNPTIEQCVCDEVRRQKQEESAAGRDPALVHDCCSEGFTDFCAILADTVCGAGCSPAVTTP